MNIVVNLEMNRTCLHYPIAKINSSPVRFIVRFIQDWEGG